MPTGVLCRPHMNRVIPFVLNGAPITRARGRIKGYATQKTMIVRSEQIRLSATDLSNHLACRHLTVLDLQVARGTRPAPGFSSPDLRVIQELGLRHEAAYLASLAEGGFSVADLRGFRNDETSASETRTRMEAGVDVIAQGTLAVGRWFGRPDLLRKVSKPSVFGDWSYEVYDCKLSRETKATTILQLALYSGF